MIVACLSRFAHTPMGVFGTLRAREFECFTVEREWKLNRPYESCIPPGIWAMDWGEYYKGGYDTLEVVGVPGRSEIKFHAANMAKELLGCIAPGATLTAFLTTWGVSSSRETLEEFLSVMRKFDGAELELVVKEAEVYSEWESLMKSRSLEAQRK